MILHCLNPIQQELSRATEDAKKSLLSAAPRIRRAFTINSFVTTALFFASVASFLSNPDHLSQALVIPGVISSISLIVLIFAQGLVQGMRPDDDVWEYGREV